MQIFSLCFDAWNRVLKAELAQVVIFFAVGIFIDKKIGNWKKPRPSSIHTTYKTD